MDGRTGGQTDRQTETDRYAESIGVSATIFTLWAPKATEFGEITQNKGHYAVHSRSLIFVITRKRICDFLLVIDINWHPVLHRFQVMADHCQIFASYRGRFTFTSFMGVSPANIRINFTSSETRIIMLPDTEDRTIVSLFPWTKHRNVTDRRTDGRKDISAVAISTLCITSNAERCINGFKHYEYYQLSGQRRPVPACGSTTRKGASLLSRYLPLTNFLDPP